MNMGKFLFITKGAYIKAYYAIAKRIPRIVHYANPPLLSVALELTNNCNLRCKICHTQNPKRFQARERGFMSWELFAKCADELGRLGYEMNVCLNFDGESLLHPKFVEMLRYLHSKNNLRLHFSTNGTLLTKDIENELIRYGVDTAVSLDGIESKHEAIRINSKYEKVKDNILNFVQLRAEYCRPKINVTLVDSEHTTSDINDFVKYWVNKIDAVYVHPFMTEDLKFRDNPSFFNMPTRRKAFCKWVFTYMAILWNGDVANCCHLSNKMNIMGNVNKNSIMEIWKGETFKKFREASLRNKFPEESICSLCELWKTEFVPFSTVVGDFEVKYAGYGKEYKAICT
jgi:radical SAM protein with 4Fe4S-binding SPASM domain